MGYIYALFDPREPDRIRYVGQTILPVGVRLGKHIAQCRYRQTYSKSWIKSLLRDGVTPEYRVLEEVEDDAQLDEAEIRWIAKLRAEGHRLTNIAEGGSSGNRGRKRGSMPQETRDKIGAANRGKSKSAEARAKMSAAHLERLHLRPRGPMSEATKAKIAAVLTGRKGISNGGKGRQRTPEQRAKISQGLRAKFAALREQRALEPSGDSTKRVFSEAHKAAISAAKRGKRRRPMSQETKDKIAASLKKKH